MAQHPSEVALQGHAGGASVPGEADFAIQIEAGVVDHQHAGVGRFQGRCAGEDREFEMLIAGGEGGAEEDQHSPRGAAIQVQLEVVAAVGNGVDAVGQGRCREEVRQAGVPVYRPFPFPEVAHGFDVDCHAFVVLCHAGKFPAGGRLPSAVNCAESCFIWKSGSCSCLAPVRLPILFGSRAGRHPEVGRLSREPVVRRAVCYLKSLAMLNAIVILTIF